MSRKNFLILILIPIYAISLILPAGAFDIEPGETKTGCLEESDPQLDDDCHYDSFSTFCEVGTLLVVTQRSTKIDCYLIVVAPDGTQWENDDYSLYADTDSRVIVPIGESGEYTIHCTSFSPETGAYELTVEENAPRRFFGVFVGMDDYGWAMETAPLCDEDAENMYDAFVESGIMNPDDGILLTNSSAKLMDVENAFHRISREITPDDNFIFFFSGHGDQVAVSSRDKIGEMDEMDEVLSLRDVDLTDNDLAMMLENLDAGLKVVVLDSCHSGGFVRDIVTGPDVICYASSEEDVTSDYAQEFKAGGWMSFFFREAILGDGDLDGDSVLMIGELTHYLYTRFHEEWPEPVIAIFGYQEFTHDRGLVSQDTIFCWWNPDRNKKPR